MKQAHQLAVINRQKMKIKEHGKTLKLLEKCKGHNGPIIPTLLILWTRPTKQINEISYLRLKIAPKIKQRRQFKLDSEKFKMVYFRTDELKCSIRNAIKVENELSNSIDTRLGPLMSNEIFFHVNDDNGN